MSNPNKNRLAILKSFTLGILVFSFICLTTDVKAQRFAYVNTDYILNHIPEYVSAQNKLDNQAASWQKEIDSKYLEIDNFYQEFQAEQVLLTPDMKRKREDIIKAKELKVKAFQKMKFGYQGELFQMRQQMIKPVQDKIYDAIQEVAKNGSLSFIFDKNSDLVMLYANPRYDKSDEVISELGYKPGELATGKEKK
jgi:outer membrane protein